MHVKWSVILAVRFDPKILTMLATNGQGLHRVGSDWKVLDWLHCQT